MQHASFRGIALVGLAVLLAGQNVNFANEKEKYTNPVLIEFDSDISYRSYRFFKRKLAKAKANKADLLILEIRSPGGLLEESMLIAEAMRDVDWADTVAFIPEKALSGGALAALGCQKIVISKTGRIGDVGVITMDANFAFRYAPEKYISDVVSRGRTLAEIHNRPPELIEAMIDQDTLVYQNKNDKTRFEKRRAVNSGYPHRQNQVAGERNKIDTNEWTLIPESDEGLFLTVDGAKAVALGLADQNASDRDELKELFNLSKLTVYRETATDVAVFWLNLPIITGLLFVIGLVALYLEFTAPGIGVGALVSGLCFSIFFWSHFLGGTAGILEVLLFLSGIVFLIMELFVIPGFGVAGLSGLLLIVSSVLMASQDFVLPQSAFQTKQLQTNLTVILGSGAAFLVAAFFISKYIGRVPVISSLMLSPPSDDQETETTKDGKTPLTSHPVVSVGDWGVSESVLRPAGKARFGNQTVDVVADGSFIEPNKEVKVAAIQGNRVLVVKA